MQGSLKMASLAYMIEMNDYCISMILGLFADYNEKKKPIKQTIYLLRKDSKDE